LIVDIDIDVSRADEFKCLLIEEKYCDEEIADW